MIIRQEDRCTFSIYRKKRSFDFNRTGFLSPTLTLLDLLCHIDSGEIENVRKTKLTTHIELEGIEMLRIETELELEFGPDIWGNDS